MADPNVDVWAIDEVHFQQYGSRCLMWIPPEETDPVLQHHPTRKSVGYFGAVRLRDGKVLFHREEERFNAMTFHSFLKYLRHRSSMNHRRVVVISDNAKYHHAKLHADWRKANESRFVLDFLPPYSPDLNPIERLWKLTRRQCIHNRYFPELENVISVIENQFKKWSQGSKTIRNLCAFT